MEAFLKWRGFRVTIPCAPIWRAASWRRDRSKGDSVQHHVKDDVGVEQNPQRCFSSR